MNSYHLYIAETATLMKEHSVPGFFVGLTISYVKALPMVAVSFTPTSE